MNFDFVDILLPLAKMLRYSQRMFLCNVVFMLFMISFLITRIFFFGFIVYRSMFELQGYIPYRYDPESDYYLNRWVHWPAMFLFLVLLVLMIYWFGLILRIALRVIDKGEAEDVRSDSDDAEEYVLLQTVGLLYLRCYSEDEKQVPSALRPKKEKKKAE